MLCPNGSSPDLQILCGALTQLSKWRSFTVLSGAFPKDLQDLEKDSVHTLPRDESFYWREPGGLPRRTQRLAEVAVTRILFARSSTTPARLALPPPVKPNDDNPSPYCVSALACSPKLDPWVRLQQSGLV